MVGRVHSIESFGTVDGPGIRMVIFLSGCPMKCLYCHNPDTWDPKGGTPMLADDILNQYEQARPFYKKGGITVSGGEPLMQIGFVTELFEKARQKGIHTCLDTSGITFNPGSQAVMALFDRLLASTDLVLLDIKHIDPEEHVKLCAQPQDNILAFAGYLKNIKALDVLPYHDMGKAKYSQMGIPYPLEDTAPLPPAKAAEARKIILRGMRDERAHCS